MGAIRDAKGKSVAQVFSGLESTQKAEVSGVIGPHMVFALFLYAYLASENKPDDHFERGSTSTLWIAPSDGQALNV